MNGPFHFTRAAVAAALAALPAASFALDLIGSYEKARQVDPTMLAADQAVLAGREKIVQGNALLKPQVSLSMALTQVNDKSSTSLPPALTEVIKPESSGRVHQVALQLKHPLYDAQASADKKELHQQAALAEVSYRHAQQDLMQRVGEAYFELLLAQENLRVVRAEKTAVAMQRDRAKARFDVGRGKVTDVQEAQARYDTVLTKEVSAESTLASQQAKYEELTGAPATGLAELAPGLEPSQPRPDSLQDWQGRAMDGNVRVQTKLHELQISGAEIEKYRLSGRPTLDLVASYAHKGQNGGLSPTISPDSSRIAQIGVQLSVPLYTGGAFDSKLRESLAKRNQAEQELGAARRDARLQVQDAFLAVKTGVSRVGALKQSVLSAQTALEATTLGRDLGTRTELDVLDAQQRLYASQLELAQARNDYLLGRIRLASAAGELQEGDLRALNAYLAP